MGQLTRNQYREALGSEGVKLFGKRSVPLGRGRIYRDRLVFVLVIKRYLYVSAQSGWRAQGGRGVLKQENRVCDMDHAVPVYNNRPSSD